MSCVRGWRNHQRFEMMWIIDTEFQRWSIELHSRRTSFHTGDWRATIPRQTHFLALAYSCHSETSSSPCQDWKMRSTWRCLSKRSRSVHNILGSSKVFELRRSPFEICLMLLIWFIILIKRKMSFGKPLAGKRKTRGITDPREESTLFLEMYSEFYE